MVTVPVPYAVIVNKNTGVQVMTDEAGNATIQRNVTTGYPVA